MNSLGHALNDMNSIVADASASFSGGTEAFHKKNNKTKNSLTFCLVANGGVSSYGRGLPERGEGREGGRVEGGWGGGGWPVDIAIGDGKNVSVNVTALSVPFSHKGSSPQAA